MDASQIEEILSTGDETQIAALMQELHQTGQFQLGYAIGFRYLKDRPWRSAGSALLDHHSICAYYTGHQKEAIEITTFLLDYRNLDAPTRDRLRSNRNYCIADVRDDFVYYPEEIVRQISARTLCENPRLSFSITTCKRPELFIRTMNSFLQCCQDVDQIDEWICVDDNSDEDSRKLMQDLYPFFKFIWKDGASKGHARSMNLIRQKARAPFLFHCEDDWQFFIPKPFLSEAREILESDPSLGQVLINRNYAEGLEEPRLVGGKQRDTSSGMQYVLHEWYPQGSAELYRMPGLHSAYWPHFSLRPSLIRKEALGKIGTFSESSEHFELEYARRYMSAGYRSCFFNTIYCLHTGRLTTERDDDIKQNAYALNDERQFGVAPKRKIRVKPIAWWLSSKELCDHFGRQSKGDYSWNRIQLTWEDNADYFVIFQYPREGEVFVPERTILFQTERREPYAGPVMLTRKLHDFPNCPDWHISLSYRELSNGQSMKKTKQFSTIMSSRYEDPGHKKRIDFLKFYEKQAGVPALDVFGKDNAHGFANYLGALPPGQKDRGLVPYRYTFHAENAAVDNYFTEKIIDAILTETLCFYWGCPNLENYLDERSFIRLNLDDFEESAQTIRRAIENDEWSKRLPVLRQEKRKILESIQFFPTLERILHEIEIPAYVISLDRRSDRWEKVEGELASVWRNFTRFAAIDGRNLVLQDAQKRLFLNNDFHNRRMVIACALSHLSLWEQLTQDPNHDHYLILEDDVEFSENFSKKVLSVFSQLREKDWDLTLLGFSIWRDKRDPSLYDRKKEEVRVACFSPSVMASFWGKMIGGSFGYLLSKSGARKLLARAESEGIGHAIDYWKMLQFQHLNVYYTSPHIVFSEYAGTDDVGMTVDSDIQSDYSPVEI